MQSSDRHFVTQMATELMQAHTASKPFRTVLRIATVTIIGSSIAACGAADGGSSGVDLVVTKDTQAVNHWMAPAGRMEIPMEIGAGTIVRGGKRNVGNSGTCTVRWTDMEKREALGGGEDEARELFLDLPCSNLAIATDADRSKRVPYGRLVPAAYGPGNDYRGQNSYLEAISTAEGVPGSGGKVSLTSPVWACKTEEDYQENLGRVGAPCIVIFSGTVLDMVSPKDDTRSNFYRVRVPVQGNAEIYVVNKGDAMFGPYIASTNNGQKRCLTTPQAECVGG